MSKYFYPTREEAAFAAQTLGIKTRQEYAERYTEDPRLPAYPWRRYPGKFEEYAFFNIARPLGRYPTFEEATLAVQKLGIKTRDEYLARYTADPRLPSKPWVLYRDVFDNYTFFNIDRPVERYQTFEEASKAARSLGIRNIKEYSSRFREDPKLHGSPHLFFKEQWKGYNHFLGIVREPRYETLEEAARAVQRLNIKGVLEYRERYQEDPMLPSNPAYCYRTEWLGYPSFLRGVVEKYPSLDEARVAVEALGLSTSLQYYDLYHLDPRLPSHPQKFYRDEWQGYPHFLKGDAYDTEYPSLAQA